MFLFLFPRFQRLCVALTSPVNPTPNPKLPQKKDFQVSNYFSTNILVTKMVDGLELGGGHCFWAYFSPRDECMNCLFFFVVDQGNPLLGIFASQNNLFIFMFSMVLTTRVGVLQTTAQSFKRKDFQEGLWGLHGLQHTVDWAAVDAGTRPSPRPFWLQIPPPKSGVIDFKRNLEPRGVATIWTLGLWTTKSRRRWSLIRPLAISGPWSQFRGWFR